MADARSFILHHYDGSPVSEKVRLILGHKGLDWVSVKVPVIMPKPDVTALTGGYRRTPIAQVGADIYCDTALIAQLLDQRVPTPSLFPASAPLAPLLAQWADSTLFWTVIPYTMQPIGLAHVFAGVPPEVLKAFGADRAPFTAGMKRQSAAEATVNLGAYLRKGGPLADIVAQHAQLDAWLSRVLGIGHGRPEKMKSEDAVALAAATTTYAACQVQAGAGFETGQGVTITPMDYGCDPVQGELVGLDGTEAVLRRTDERAGTVHVHFPRAGYQIKAL